MRVDGSSSPGSVVHAEAADVPSAQNAPADVPHAQDAPAVRVPPLHPPLAPGDTEYAAFVLKVKEPVVTVSAVSRVSQERAKYRTGFIVRSTDNYALVYTSIQSDALVSEAYYYSVYLEENKESVKAEFFRNDPDEESYILLFVPTKKRYATVSFMDIDMPMMRQRVLTIAAKAGTQLRPDGPIIQTFIGQLDLYQGRVLTPSCSAMTLDRKPLEGSEKFFEVSCNARDNIVCLESIDDPKHTADRLATAPVFALSDKLLGCIHSLVKRWMLKMDFYANRLSCL